MLSIEQRYNVCLMAEKHPKWTQQELAKWAYETFQLSKVPSQGTISRLLAKKALYMNSKEHEKDANRLRKPNNPLVRRILQEWISQSLWCGIPMTSPIIQSTAQAIWHRIPSIYREGNGTFSYKWITNFLSKNDFNISMLDEEPPRTPKIWTFEERDQLKDLLRDVPPVDLFTLDETFLAYNLPLDYAQYEQSSIQRLINVATVMLCANLDGTEKLNPVVVGKYKCYRSFKKYFPNNTNNDQLQVSQEQWGDELAKKFGISYHSNRKSWLTSNLFHDWLVRWDKHLVADNRRIWIVLDDSCPHRIVNIRLHNITLVYTSANSRFLPFNWGVLDEFKSRYRIQQYKALINLQQRIEQTTKRKTVISFEQSRLTMSNAFKFIREAWDDISMFTIRANWKSSGVVPPEVIQLDSTVSMAFKKNEALEAELNSLCQAYYCEKKWDYEMLLDLNIENKNTNFLSTEELIESAIVDPIEEEEGPHHEDINVINQDTPGMPNSGISRDIINSVGVNVPLSTNPLYPTSSVGYFGMPNVDPSGFPINNNSNNNNTFGNLMVPPSPKVEGIPPTHMPKHIRAGETGNLVGSNAYSGENTNFPQILDGSGDYDTQIAFPNVSMLIDNPDLFTNLDFLDSVPLGGAEQHPYNTNSGYLQPVPDGGGSIPIPTDVMPANTVQEPQQKSVNNDLHSSGLTDLQNANLTDPLQIPFGNGAFLNDQPPPDAREPTNETIVSDILNANPNNPNALSLIAASHPFATSDDNLLAPDINAVLTQADSIHLPTKNYSINFPHDKSPTVSSLPTTPTQTLPEFNADLVKSLEKILRYNKPYGLCLSVNTVNELKSAHSNLLGRINKNGKDTSNSGRKFDNTTLDNLLRDQTGSANGVSDTSNIPASNNFLLGRDEGFF